MFIHADFDCAPDELAESVCPCKLRMQLLIPPGPTAKGSDRIVDFAFVHDDLFPLLSPRSFPF